MWRRVAIAGLLVVPLLLAAGLRSSRAFVPLPHAWGRNARSAARSNEGFMALREGQLPPKGAAVIPGMPGMPVGMPVAQGPAEKPTGPAALSFTRRKYFYGTVTLPVGDGNIAELMLPPSVDEPSALAVVEVEIGTANGCKGLVLREEHGNKKAAKGRVRVVIVDPGSQAEAAGFRVGDYVRAITAHAVRMEGTMEKGFFGNEYFKPSLRVGRQVITADNEPLFQLLGAQASNSLSRGGSGLVAYVVERVFDREEPQEPPASTKDLAAWGAAA
jgi:hypothetical protein